KNFHSNDGIEPEKDQHRDFPIRWRLSRGGIGRHPSRKRSIDAMLVGSRDKIFRLFKQGCAYRRIQPSIQIIDARKAHQRHPARAWNFWWLGISPLITRRRSLRLLNAI